MAVLADTVLDRARVALNDVAIDLYSDEVLLPFLKIANDDLSDEMIDNGSTVQKDVSADLTLTIGAVSPTLPDDFLLPISVFEKNVGDTDDQYVRLDQKRFIPNVIAGINLGWWSWRDQTIFTSGSTQIKKLRVRYYRILSTIQSESSPIEITHSINYLAYHTAALAAELIGRNYTAADRLEMKAQDKLTKLLKKETKQNQSEPVRRRGFGNVRRLR